MPDHNGLSFIVPAYNEEEGIRETLEELKDVLSATGLDHEIIVVDDASSDRTSEIVSGILCVALISHPVNMGYGKALKTGIEKARYDWVGIMDADGTYPADQIPFLVDEMSKGFDMVIASRGNTEEYDGLIKGLSRRIYKFLVNTISGHKIDDPNSGLRIFRRAVALEFHEFLCDRFSFTTSLSILSSMKPYCLKYVNIDYQARKGNSHVKHLRDSITTMRIMVEGVTYYNPLRFFILLVFTMILTVGFPAMVLALMRMHTLSLYYMIFGCTVSILIGIGVLADVVRVSCAKLCQRM